MFKVLLILCIALNVIYAKQNYVNIIIDEVTSIYDGDTFRVNINSYPSIIGQNMPIRVNGIDTPELRTKCNKEKVLALKAKKLTVLTLGGAKVIELKNLQRGKYFRIVADVYVADKSLGNILIANNLAVRYNGGTKVKNWCE